MLQTDRTCNVISYNAYIIRNKCYKKEMWHLNYTKTSTQIHIVLLHLHTIPQKHRTSSSGLLRKEKKKKKERKKSRGLK